jgi:multidrug efflux pump subunit AcrB
VNLEPITRFFVDRYQFTVVLFLMLVAMGIATWAAIPRAEDPVVPIPAVRIVALYPGASATELERQVSRRVEERIAELEDVKELRTVVVDGMGHTFVEFRAGVDVDRKYEEVLREVNAVRPELPDELHSLRVRKVSASDVNVVQVALVSGTASWNDLRLLAEALEERLEAVPGVRQADTWAFPEREVAVRLDVGRMASLGITPGEVLRAVSSDNASIPAGTLDEGGRRFSVRTSGELASLDELRGTVVRAGPAGLVSLGDLADVAWGYAEPTHLARFDGERAVFVTANQRPDVNVGRVSAGIRVELDAFETTLPAGVGLRRGFDQAENVHRRLRLLGRDFALAILLVSVTLLPLGLRAAGIVMVSIPLSMAMGLTALHQLGFTINQLSIVGFVIALGLLVDDSIVVVENIARFRREGHSRRSAALLATRQISIAVIGCTATLVLAFLPLIFLPGTSGAFIRVLPLTVVFTVLASLFVALTIIPWLASRVLPASEDPEGNVFMRRMQAAIRVTYAPLLDRSLRSPRRTMALAALLFAASLGLVPVVGFSLFPRAGTPQFLVDVRTPEGSSLEETDRAARFAERALGERPEVRAVMTNVGRDNPQIYYNVIPRSENPSVGQLFVLLHRYEPRRTPVLLDSLRATLAAYPGARLEVREFENGPPIDAPVAIRLTGPDLDTLRALAARLEEEVRATEGTMYVDNPVRLARTDLKVEVDRHRAALAGVPTVEVDRTVRLGIAGLAAGSFRDETGEAHPVRLRLLGQGAPAMEALDRLYVTGERGGAVPLSQVASVRFASSTPRIQRFAQERAVTVTAWVRSGYNTDRVTRSLLSRLEAMEMPAGYRWTAAGEIESRQESFGGVGGAVIVAVFMILAVLVLEFRTFRSTLIVASVIPLGVIGGLTALWATGNTLSFTATVGFVALIGIEIKTSILLVDFTNRLREEGVELMEAIRRAGEVRFVPVLLTAMTAVGGLLPLALEGSPLYSPLAWVIIGGLISSTLLARLVTPVMYLLLAPAVEVRGEGRESVADGVGG